MTIRILLLMLVSLFALGCCDPCDDPVNVECLSGDADSDGIINSEDTAPTDPCLPEDNLACPSGDLDNDGIINSLDSDPLDPCLPNVPALELNIIGTWSYSSNKIIEFVEDGTYRDIEGQIISFAVGDDVAERNWKIENENTLVIQLVNTSGQSAKADFISTSQTCDEMTFELASINLTLTRI